MSASIVSTITAFNSGGSGDMLYDDDQVVLEVYEAKASGSVTVAYTDPKGRRNYVTFNLPSLVNAVMKSVTPEDAA